MRVGLVNQLFVYFSFSFPVSNDRYHDLIRESRSYEDAIENRLLQFNFLKDENGVFDIFKVGIRFLFHYLKNHFRILN